MLFETASVLAFAVLASAGACKPEKPTTTVEWETAYTGTSPAEVAQAAATAKTRSPTSNVPGKAFDRFVMIWFENTDYDKAAADPNFAKFAKKGITLSNYFAVTHPSEPNYFASICGDHLGMQNDDFNRAAKNVSTIIDVLEDAGISWGSYQEDMPYSGYEGFDYVNQETGANDYVRKHNPSVLFDSIAGSEHRLAHIKNLSMTDRANSQFHKDLNHDKLPQWMFITPNMTSDGHDSSVTVAGKWTKEFLTPLLSNDNFMQNTLVVLTWDENETYSIQNNILAILLGDAVPRHLHGTTDDTYYSHYSEMSTVEANWDLPTLGRWDVGANVYDVVARKTGDVNRRWNAEKKLDSYFWNSSYAGPFNTDGGNQEYPAPNLKLDDSYSGRPIFQGVKDTWEGSENPTYYHDSIKNPDGIHPPKGYAPVE